MSTELKFWCEFFVDMCRFTSYILDCANNFFNQQYCPHDRNLLCLEIQLSDIFLGVTNVAFMFSKDFYARWISEKQKMLRLEHLQTEKKFQSNAGRIKHSW